MSDASLSDITGDLNIVPLDVSSSTCNHFPPVPLESPLPQPTGIFDVERNTRDPNVIPVDVSSLAPNPFPPVPLENLPPEPTAVFELEPSPMAGDVLLPSVAGDLNIFDLGTSIGFPPAIDMQYTDSVFDNFFDIYGASQSHEVGLPQ